MSFQNQPLHICQIHRRLDSNVPKSRHFIVTFDKFAITYAFIQRSSGLCDVYCYRTVCGRRFAFYSYYFLWFCIPFRPFEYFGFIYVVTKGGVGWNFDHIEFDPWGLYLQAVLNLWICGVRGGG